MVWIKRNLIFVISVAVGLLLTGYCSYLLYSSLDANSGVSEEYKTTLSNLQAMQTKVPFPSEENIQNAKEDQEQARQLLADFRKCFAPFPPPPVEDERGFKTYLSDNLVQFRAEATNAGVQLPPDFGFAFSSLRGRLTYPAGNIEPWMQQLEEISAILDVLYAAKVNHLDDVKRVPVAIDDASATDCFQDAPVTNQLGVFTPYKINFRGFSTEIAAVLEGFASASNCFVVKSIAVAPDTSTAEPTAQSAAPAPVQAMMRRPETYLPPYRRTPTMNGVPGRLRVQSPTMTMSGAPAPVAASGPLVTLLSEHPLTVTLSVDVVKLKAAER